ncbi:uncharacterized protein LOC133495712 isoform X2 [Syngnathoides biaculeatus]|uniref:uncharacterized protein LOC133495712 isoform X2 n=1 Tax=Syngnathoides biaculeatus TaxID=300417 RepID=UPI002ADE6483|nr:uncharacterized protein LOC133495712 isoform X2 [Syngnathoides biaculeatus]
MQKRRLGRAKFALSIAAPSTRDDSEALATMAASGFAEFCSDAETLQKNIRYLEVKWDFLQKPAGQLELVHTTVAVTGFGLQVKDPDPDPDLCVKATLTIAVPNCLLQVRPVSFDKNSAITTTTAAAGLVEERRSNPSSLARTPALAEAFSAPPASSSSAAVQDASSPPWRQSSITQRYASPFLLLPRFPPEETKAPRIPLFISQRWKKGRKGELGGVAAAAVLASFVSDQLAARSRAACGRLGDDDTVSPARDAFD